MAEHEIEKRENAIHLFRIDSFPTKFLGHFNRATGFFSFFLASFFSCLSIGIFFFSLFPFLGQAYLFSLITVFLGSEKQRISELELENLHTDEKSHSKIGSIFLKLLRLVVGSVDLIPYEMKEGAIAMSMKVYLSFFSTSFSPIFLLLFLFCLFLLTFLVSKIGLEKVW